MYLDNKTKSWAKKYQQKKYQKIRDKIINSFSDLTFDEGPHIYTLNGEIIPSVSSMVDKFIEPFPKTQMAERCSEKYFNDPSSIYFGMTADDIAKKWKEDATKAANQGTAAHEFGESCMHYMIGDYDGILPAFKDRLTENGLFESHGGFEDAIVKFWNDMPDAYIPILAETRVYAKCGTDRPLYAGTFDLLVYCNIPEKKGLLIFDYKTNKNLYNNFNGKKMLLCLDNLLDMDKNHYEVQQCLYENALNEIGLDILGKRLVWIKPSGEYEPVRLTEKIKSLVVETLQEIA